jgi:hypothetical protein
MRGILLGGSGRVLVGSGRVLVGFCWALVGRWLVVGCDGFWWVLLGSGGVLVGSDGFWWFAERFG